MEPPAGARRAVEGFVVRPSRVLMGLVALAFAAGLEVPHSLQYVPFAASLVFLGLPHGAVDHLAPARLLVRESWPWSVLGVALLYAVLSASYLALWFASPAASFVLFVGLTWFHWGAGDLHSLLAIARAGYLRTRALRLLTLLMRGGLPMLVPLVAFPGVYRGTARDLVSLFDPWAVPGIDWAFSPSFRLLAGASFAALALSVLALGRRSARSREDTSAWREDAFETVLLSAFFALVPPLLAVGLYFCVWHSARFVARLMLLDASSPLKEGRLLPALASFFRDAAPLTAVALGLLVALYFVAPGAGNGAPALLALYLVLISALTLPHVAVVLWMDRKEGLFAVHRFGQPR